MRLSSTIRRALAAFSGVLFLLPAAVHAQPLNYLVKGSGSTVYFNSPSLSKDFQMDQWMNTLEMNFDVKLYEDSDFSASFHGIVTPTYDAVYDLYPRYYGDRRRAGSQGDAGNATNAMSRWACDGRATRCSSRCRTKPLKRKSLMSL